MYTFKSLIHQPGKFWYRIKKELVTSEILPSLPSLTPLTPRELKKILNDWKLAGSPIPPPAEYKILRIRDISRKYKLTNLIETGTYVGNTPIQLQNDFKTIHTIELNKALYSQAKAHLASIKQICVWYGNSAKILRKIIPELPNPSLFWLDAHFSGGITGRGWLDTPIMQELELILDRTQKDCILVDDARLFNGQNDYPSLEQLIYFISNKRPDLEVTNITDIIYILPRH